MREDTEVLGQLNDAKALEQSQRRDGGVEIQAGGEAGAKDQAKGFQRVHGRARVPGSSLGGTFQSTTKAQPRVRAGSATQSKRPGGNPGRLRNFQAAAIGFTGLAATTASNPSC